MTLFRLKRCPLQILLPKIGPLHAAHPYHLRYGSAPPPPPPPPPGRQLSFIVSVPAVKILGLKVFLNVMVQLYIQMIPT